MPATLDFRRNPRDSRDLAPGFPQPLMRHPLVLILAVLLPAIPAWSQTCADRSGNYTARISLCDQALDASDNPGDAAFALAMKGEAQRMLGDYEAAAATLQQALEVTLDNSWVWVELGNVRHDQGDLAGALAHYSAALAVEDHADAWANGAEAWWQFRMDQRCSDDADNALRLDPEHAFANEMKGRCVTVLGRAQEAISYFDMAIALAPGYQNAYWNKLAALAVLGRHQEVITTADKAMSPDVVPNPNPVIEVDILSRRLMAVAQMESPETVTAGALALLARYPDNLTALHILGRALLDAGKAAEADAATQILRSNPDDKQMAAIFHDTLARIDVALDRLDDV